MVSGPFGEIKYTELTSNRFVTLHTDQGDIKIQVNPDVTPKTAANFILLARKGFFDGTKFHRIIKGFMIQGGDPNSKDDKPEDDGTGGPGYTFPDENIVGDYKRGVVAMANSGPNTNGSQFFIMHQDSQLPKSYVIFGQVVSGMDVVDKIAELPVVANSQGEQSQPKTAPVITKAEVTTN
jgi:cyclophilin family peptidyl-prolyl cis-trans isomerase